MRDIFEVLGKINKEQYKRRKMNMTHLDIPKKQKNGIMARLVKAVEKYGFNEVRLTANHYFSEVIEKRKLEREIKEKEKELIKLKKIK